MSGTYKFNKVESNYLKDYPSLITVIPNKEPVLLFDKIKENLKNSDEKNNNYKKKKEKKNILFKPLSTFDSIFPINPVDTKGLIYDNFKNNTYDIY